MEMMEVVQAERNRIMEGLEVVEEIPLWGKVTLLIGEFYHIKEVTEEGETIVRSPKPEEVYTILRILKS